MSIALRFTDPIATPAQITAARDEVLAAVNAHELTTQAGLLALAEQITDLANSSSGSGTYDGTAG